MSDTLRYDRLPYRGEIRGLDAVGSRLIFTTEHPEGQPTGIYEYDLDGESMRETSLDCGVTAQLLVDGELVIAATDGSLRRSAIGEEPKSFAKLEERVVALAKTSTGIAAAGGTNVYFVASDGSVETFDLGEPARSLASDPTGTWVVAGTARGHLVVFHDEEGFAETSRERLHDGEVTALAFPPDELRVYSTATDCRLLVSYVRGSFDSDDRGGTNMHESAVHAIQMGPDFETADGTTPRFYTAGMDSTIKAWRRSRSGSQRSASFDDGVVQTYFLAAIDLDETRHLAAAGENTIRVFGFEESGKLEKRAVYISDAYDRAQDQLGSSTPADRQGALEDLAGFADERALDAMSQHLHGRESDHKLQVHGVGLLSKVAHPKAVKLIESFFHHSASDVRVAAFEGLDARVETEPLDVIRLAADAGHEDLGLRAVALASDQAAADESAADQLLELLDHEQARVRHAAHAALEKHHGESAEGTLVGLRSTHADLRRHAIIRLRTRKLVGSARVDSRLRRLWDDEDDQARRLAFIVAAHRSENLVRALRARDEEFHRQVFELEEHGKDETQRRKEVPAAPAFNVNKLGESDFRSLLEAMGSRSIDVSLRGARALAILGDERSFGTLLQLSREAQANARVTVCHSLRVLGDPRGIRRVRAMLHDEDGQVRDAAFTALASLQESRPLSTAQAGLSAPSADVRKRALALLVATIKDGASESEAGALLLQALNDVDESLRLEAFKATLNLGVAGGGPDTLRFILRSSQESIRYEALREARSHDDDGHKAVVLEMIDDESEMVRREAFEFGLDRWPSTEHQKVYRAGLSSKHAAQREMTVAKLASVKSEFRSLLVDALDDEAERVRLAAVQALVQAENRPLLANALESEHLDVRVEAARALAALGDDRALAPLLAIVEGYHALVASKATDEEIAIYRTSLERATKGLQELGHPGAIDAILTLIEAEDQNVANGAAATLPAIAAPSNLEKIRGLTQHESAAIRNSAALALAYNGDASVAPIVFSQLQPSMQLFAALGLREDSPERLLAMVDSDDSSIRTLALALVLALELSEHAKNGVPERSLALLSAKDAYVRLSAAEALEHYADQPKFYGWVYEMLNGLKHPADAWKAEPKELLKLSRAVTFGDPRLAVRAGIVLSQLMQPKADEFERQFALFEERFAPALEALERRANERKTEPVGEKVASAWHRIKEKARSLVVEPQTFEEALDALAFGAYIGLARQQHASNSHHLRAAAISGLTRIAANEDALRQDAISVMLLALADPNQSVRERAFENLRKLGCDDQTLSTEALSTSFSDMGFRGLELLAADPKGGERLLKETLLTSTSGLENEAGELLIERVGEIEVHRIGLGAASIPFRTKSVRGLAEKYDQAEAADALRGALDSRHEDVRHLAARELAARKDRTAHDTLIGMLTLPEDHARRQALSALETLRQPGTAGDLVDLVEADEEHADASLLLSASARFSDISIFERLIGFIDDDHHRRPASQAALQLTGYPQYEWVDDDDVTSEWEESLDPRHPEQFAELFELAYRIADEDLLGSLVGLAKWPPENESLDQTLGALATFSNDGVRHRAVEIIGWRLLHRNGVAEVLEETLTSSDPLDQFYAAEGLALAGHDDGLPVLQTAVDAMDDWSLRQRAVLAIGRLADPTTVDLLLALASDDASYLQGAAAEAIGHMSASERSDEVFATLQRLSSEGSYDRIESALRGLRWFDTPGSWDILRQKATGDNWWVAQKSVELLRFDPDSLPVIEEVLRKSDDWDVANSAAQSLRHIHGPESLEPDYLALQAEVGVLDDHDKALERLRERGDAARLMQVLATIPEENISQIAPDLVAILLARDPLPVGDAASMLGSHQARTASVAAQIIGRAGPDEAADHREALVEATRKAREDWLATWKDFIANRQGAGERLDEIETRYRRMVWACGQVEAGAEEIRQAAMLPDHQRCIGIREEAVSSLGDPWMGKAGIETLVELATGRDARLRSMAAAELDRAAPEESARLLSGALHDDVSFGRLVASLDEKEAGASLRNALGKAAGIALPRLAAMQDIDGLEAAMRDAELAQTTRRGAIDALGTIASDEAAARLASFGSDEEEDELLRKAAWRARRRVNRAIASREEAR